jgi:hypothetical protein
MELTCALWHTRFQARIAMLMLISIFKFGYPAQVPSCFNADVVELVDTQDLKS